MALWALHGDSRQGRRAGRPTMASSLMKDPSFGLEIDPSPAKSSAVNGASKGGILKRTPVYVVNPNTGRATDVVSTDRSTRSFPLRDVPKSRFPSRGGGKGKVTNIGVVRGTSEGLNEGGRKEVYDDDDSYVGYGEWEDDEGGNDVGGEGDKGYGWLDEPEVRTNEERAKRRRSGEVQQRVYWMRNQLDFTPHSKILLLSDPLWIFASSYLSSNLRTRQR